MEKDERPDKKGQEGTGSGQKKPDSNTAKGADFGATRAYPSPDFPMTPGEKGTKPGIPTVPPPQRIPPTIPEITLRPMRPAPAWRKYAWMYIVGALLLALLLLSIMKKGPSTAPRAGSTPAPGTDEQLTEVVSERTVLPQYLKPRVDKWQYHEVRDELLWGKAPIPAAEARPLLSATDDSEMAAIVLAFRNRIEAAFGSKTGSWRNGTRKTIAGNLLGFRLQSFETMIPDQQPTIEVTLETPNRGMARVQDNRLAAVKNTDLSRLKQELGRAGIEAIVNPQPATEGMVTVRLKQAAYPAVAPEFLIATDQVGAVRVGMPVSKMEALFPKTYLLAAKPLRLGSRNYTVFKIHDDKQNPLLFVYELNGKVLGISPVSDKYRTAQGIGIGSSLGEVLAYTPKVTFANKERQTIARVDGINAQFFFDEQKIDFKNKAFLPEAKIESIVIGEAPAAEEKE